MHQAGIEGILYPSKRSGKECLAIFPDNFAMTSSYIQLDDEPPHARVERRIDSNNWRVCTLSPQELIEGTST
ncbi:MAG: RES family NAD+ phosphorylase [Acidobacteriaceae bacterium]